MFVRSIWHLLEKPNKRLQRMPGRAHPSNPWTSSSLTAIPPTRVDKRRPHVLRGRRRTKRKGPEHQAKASYQPRHRNLLFFPHPISPVRLPCPSHMSNWATSHFPTSWTASAAFAGQPAGWPGSCRGTSMEERLRAEGRMA